MAGGAGPNFHVYPSDLRYASRILRHMEVARDLGIFGRVVAVGIASPAAPAAEVRPEGTLRRLGLTSARVRSSGVLGRLAALVEFNARVFVELTRARPALVCAHAVTVLPACVLVARLTGCGLVYDTHELETETSNCHGVQGFLFRAVERSLVRFAAGVVTVSPLIQRWYEDRYRDASVHCVRNIDRAVINPANVPGAPLGTTSSCRSGPRRKLRATLGIGDAELVFIYVGLLDEGRGIETSLQVFAHTPEKHLLLVGFGELEPRARQASERCKNIHFLPAVAPSEVGTVLAAADVGLCLIEGQSLSYCYSLPNKLYQYAASGLPILATDLPQIRVTVASNKWGWLVRGNGPDELCQALADICPTAVREVAKGVTFDPHEAWRQDSATLGAVYRQAACPPRRSSAPKIWKHRRGTSGRNGAR